jgi:hypothetical protein
LSLELRNYQHRERGKKGYETERKNRGVGSDWVHFALASWGADSGPAFVFSASRLHLEVCEGQGISPGESWLKELGSIATV